MDPDGNDVAVHAEGEAAAEEEGAHGESHGESEGQNCHFHAGVEYDPLDFMLNLLLLTRVTGTVLVVRAKGSLAAFGSASTTSDFELVRSS